LKYQTLLKLGKLKAMRLKSPFAELLIIKQLGS
jgi:hypothetical protein